MRLLLSESECKSIQLQILDEVDTFCKEHKLRYSLAYGTLLGAVRHKGYIPWDDDIDLLMPRPDYNYFLEYFSSSVNEVIDLNNSEVCVETFAKVARKGTVMRDVELGRELWGVNIDIFPIDGAPKEDINAHYASIVSLYSWIPRLCPFYKVVGVDKIKWYIKYIVKRIRYFHFGSCHDIKEELVKKLEQFPFESSPMAGAYFGDDEIREFMPRQWFEDFIEMEFEGKFYKVLSRYDDYLKKLFGDYMELPPDNERHSHHRYDSYIEE